jgi:hypothetical protein
MQGRHPIRKKERNSQDEVKGEERGRGEEQDSHVLVEKPNFKMQCGIVGFFPIAPK